MPAQPSLVGEPLALDLVNTRTATADLLATPDDLRTWLALQADRLRDPDGAEAASLGSAWIHRLAGESAVVRSELG